MDLPTTASDGFELRNPQGQTVGVFVPNADLLKKILQQSATESDLRQQVAALASERDQLRKELPSLREALQNAKSALDENGPYLASLYSLTRQRVSFTPKELADLEVNGISLDAVIAEIKAI